MGHNQRHQTSSSGVVAAVLVAFLLFAIVGIIVVAVVGLFFVRSSRMQSEMVTYERMATVASLEAEEMAMDLEASSIPETPTKTISVSVRIDHVGDTSVDGEKVDLDTLKSQLMTLKQETNDRLSLELTADSECLFKHVLSVINLCEEIGDIEFRIVPADASDSSTDENDSQE